MVNQMNIRSVYHVPNIFLEIRLLLMLGHLVSHDHIGMAYEEPPCPWCRARGAVPGRQNRERSKWRWKTSEIDDGKMVSGIWRKKTNYPKMTIIMMASSSSKIISESVFVGKCHLDGLNS
jgi:hypothetical protein